MKERQLAGSITVDVCWHNGRVYVVRHSPKVLELESGELSDALVVESFAGDLSDQRTHLVIPLGANAGARITSWEGSVFVAYRDEADQGHLTKLESGEVWDLGTASGQRPFAMGNGFCAVLFDNPPKSAKVYRLSNPSQIFSVHVFPDFVPTGLSHLEQGRPVSWDSQRTLQPWGLAFVRSGPVLIAQGRNDDGLVGKMDGRDGWLLLWRDALMNDQRVAANGERAAVIAWQPAAPARLAIVGPEDLVADQPQPQPQPDPVPVPVPVPVTEDRLAVPAYPRKILFAVYYSHRPPEEGGDTPQEEMAGHCPILVEKEGDPSRLPAEVERVRQLGLPMVVEGRRREAEGAVNSTLAWWCGAGYFDGESHPTRGPLREYIAACLERPVKPVIAYLDGQDMNGWPAQKPSDWDSRVRPTVQCYRNPGETLEALKSRVQPILDRVAGYGGYIGLELACYTRNQHPDGSPVVPVADILEALWVADQWIRDYPVAVVTLFADRRRSGMITHPEFRVMARRMLRGVVARPNRFDGWDSPNLDDQIRNKLDQSVELTMWSPREEARIRELLNGGNGDGGGPIEPPDEPPASGTLDDQLELVRQTRKQLFPQLFQPGHPDANGDGWLRLDHNGNGMERGALWAKHLAWRLRHLGVGLARAKPGSANHGGATQAVPEGFTTDIVAIASGVHWDFQIDSGAAGYPGWAMEEHPENYPPIAQRFVPAFDPSTP